MPPPTPEKSAAAIFSRSVGGGGAALAFFCAAAVAATPARLEATTDGEEMCWQRGVWWMNTYRRKRGHVIREQRKQWYDAQIEMGKWERLDYGGESEEK
jgi:hypothetical protein